MAAAAAGRKSSPPHLKLAGGRGNGTDSGGRKVAPPPPFSRALPKKPKTLSETASQMWDEVVAGITDVGMLKPMDGWALEALCEAYARWADAKNQRLRAGMLAKNSQGVVISPLLRIEAEASREFRAWCAEFGLTPAAEVKLSSQQEESNGDGVF